VPGLLQRELLLSALASSVLTLRPNLDSGAISLAGVDLLDLEALATDVIPAAAKLEKLTVAQIATVSRQFLYVFISLNSFRYGY
jgi:hypothetical protein